MKEVVMYKDRFDAANQLVEQLAQYKDNPEVIILAIPRGGLELGYVLAQNLHAPLDVLFSKKIGAPGNPELAIGAVTLTEQEVDPRYKDDLQFQDYIDSEIKRIRELLKKRYEQYRGSQKPIDYHNKIVIVVDDGIATGKTLKLALKDIKKYKPKKIVLAVPVGTPDTIKKLEKYTDEVICLHRPQTFFGIGQFYHNFAQVDDEKAIRLLQDANK